jgi:hypothetical protein
MAYDVVHAYIYSVFGMRSKHHIEIIDVYIFYFLIAGACCSGYKKAGPVES